MSEAVFDTPVIASIYSGMLLCDMSDLHRDIERLAGGPVWTHQLPRVSEELKPRIAEACPQIAAFDYSGVNRETVGAERIRLVNECGAVVMLSFPLLAGHAPDPMRDLPEGADVIIMHLGDRP